MKTQPGWALPNLHEAQQRTQKEVTIEKSLFQIPSEVRTLGQGKKYYLRTYGCQANEREDVYKRQILASLMEMMD